MSYLDYFTHMVLHFTVDKLFLFSICPCKACRRFGVRGEDNAAGVGGEEAAAALHQELFLLAQAEHLPRPLHLESRSTL